MTMDVSQLTEALPRQLSFYHLGEVRLGSLEQKAPDPSELVDLCGVAFNFKNDLTGLLIILFERGLDPSVYTELGNLIASQAATKLSREGADVMITPPRALSDNQLATILFSGQPMVHRAYHHYAQGLIVPVHALIIPIPSEGVGHA